MPVSDCEALKGGPGWATPHLVNLAESLIFDRDQKIFSWAKFIYKGCHLGIASSFICEDPKCHWPNTGCDCLGPRSVASNALQSGRCPMPFSKNWVFGISQVYVRISVLPLTHWSLTGLQHLWVLSFFICKKGIIILSRQGPCLNSVSPWTCIRHCCSKNPQRCTYLPIYKIKLCPKVSTWS